jgi:hypothetical protein
MEFLSETYFKAFFQIENDKKLMDNKSVHGLGFNEHILRFTSDGLLLAKLRSL